MLDRYDVVGWSVAVCCGALIGIVGRNIGMATWEAAFASLPVTAGVACIASAWRARRR